MKPLFAIVAAIMSTAALADDSCRLPRRAYGCESLAVLTYACLNHSPRCAFTNDYYAAWR